MPILLRHFPTLQTLWANRSLNHDRKPNESPQFGFFGLCVLGLVAAAVRCRAFAGAGIPTTATQYTFGTSRESCVVGRRCYIRPLRTFALGSFPLPKTNDAHRGAAAVKAPDQPCAYFVATSDQGFPPPCARTDPQRGQD